MRLMIRIDTARLHIRPFAHGDLDARHALGRECFGSAEPLEDTRSWLEWSILNVRHLAALYQPPYGDLALVEREGGAVIGSVGLVPAVVPWGVLPELRAPLAQAHTRVTPEFGLFWAVRPAWQRRGLALEAAQALCGWVFAQIGAQRVVATTTFGNAASQRVMEKLGMRLYRNASGQPHWFEVVGVLEHPQAQ
jgi:RimJ/RimL family protein N-acetyltransferase